MTAPKSMEKTADKRYSMLLKQLKALSQPKAIANLAKFGITPERTFGVSLPDLRKLAKELGTDHQFAQQLWTNNIRETRILASLIADPQLISEQQMEQWALDFDYWEICDQCCSNLFRYTPIAYQKAIEWSTREEEFVKRAGFALMAGLVISDKKAPNTQFEQFFPLIIREATDARPMVKKAINWALRQMGKRNLELNKRAIDTAKVLQKLDAKSANWIASDALRELRSEAVQKRLLQKKK